MKFATKYPDAIPRMVAWEIPKRLAFVTIENVLKSKELEVHSKLIPTELELARGGLLERVGTDRRRR